MNEDMQNLTLDKLIFNCPVFKNVPVNVTHNKEIKLTKGYILCEIDTYYEFRDFAILIEEKTRDSKACHKKMETQMKRYKQRQDIIQDMMQVYRKPVYYFYAHFEKDLLHLEYEGYKEPFAKW